MTTNHPERFTLASCGNIDLDLVAEARDVMNDSEATTECEAWDALAAYEREQTAELGGQEYGLMEAICEHCIISMEEGA